MRLVGHWCKVSVNLLSHFFLLLVHLLKNDWIWLGRNYRLIQSPWFSINVVLNLSVYIINYHCTDLIIVKKNNRVLIEFFYYQLQ